MVAFRAMQQIEIRDCKKENGPKGEGYVSVWFERSGKVSRVVIDGPPFADTSVGECVAAKYRVLRVPPFSGEEGRVPTSFRIE
jgi:hypothetical protein